MTAADAPAVRHPARLHRSWTLAAAGFTFGALAVAMVAGPVGVPPAQVGRVLADRLPLIEIHHGLAPTLAAAITEVRLPRVLLAAAVGAVLSVAGGAYQATFGNPLADPYLLGIAAGAGLGVTVAVTTTAADLAAPGVITTAAAFGGAGLATVLVYALGRDADRVRTTEALILAGIAVAALCSAVQMFLLQRDDESLRDVYSWLLGRFNVAGWAEVRLLAVPGFVCIAVIIAAARHLDLLTLGDDDARALGVDPVRTRRLVIAVATLGTAAAVAVGGLIGFVGIIVPHALRLVAGSSYRRILPLSAICGAGFLCLADLVARTALAPAEMPIGVVTACLGAPMFLVVLRTRRR